MSNTWPEQEHVNPELGSTENILMNYGCSRRFIDRVLGLEAQLEVSEKLKQDYFEQCGVLVDIIDKARVDPNADQSVESAIDNSYTGQIAQLQKQLEAVRAAIKGECDCNNMNIGMCLACHRWEE